jgi:hypothetical protein
MSATATNGADAAGDYHRQRSADGAACLQAALDYAALGWSVSCCCPPDHVGVGKGHICKSPGKSPLHRWKEFQEQPASAEQVLDWWRTWPNANVGLVLGPVSGLVRVDIDGPGGEARLLELSQGDLPPTLEFTSGRENAGRGLLYRIPEGVTLRTTTERPGAKEELRFQAQGAQTVLPPSRHPSGTLYAWRPGHGPADLSPAPMPAWMVKLLREARPSRNGLPPSANGQVGAPIAEGGRNDTLFRLGCSMRSKGFGHEAILAALQAENAERCEPPLEEREVETIARHCTDYYAVGLANGAPAGAALGPFTVGPLALRPGPAYRTPSGKLSLPVAVLRAGTPVDQLLLTSSASGRQAAAKLLRQHAPDQDVEQVGRTLAAVLAAAAEALEHAPAHEGPRLAEVLRAEVPNALRIVNRTGRGLISEARQDEITRADFLAFTPAWLLEKASSAVDAPRAACGQINRIGLLDTVRKELEVLWADLVDGTPRDGAAELRRALSRVWHAPKLVQRVKDLKTGEVHMLSASLISLVCDKLKSNAAHRRWQRIRKPFLAWWRQDVAEDGEVLPVLAMCFELAAQLQVDLPGVSDLASLRLKGERFGLVEPKADGSQGPRPGGRTRAVALSRVFTAELLSDLEDEQAAAAAGEKDDAHVWASSF